VKVKTFDQIIHKSIRTGAGGAIRIYFLSRSLDIRGSGFIYEDALDNFGKQLGVNINTWNRWKRNAFEIHFLIRGGNNTIRIPAIQKICAELELEDAGHQFEIFAGLLVKKNWKAYVFAGHETQFERPISRKTLKQLSGVGISTQRKYDKLCGTKRTPNYVTIENPTAKEQELAQRKHTPFLQCANGNVIQRLPDNREVPIAIATPKKYGRAKKVKKLLRYQTGLLLEVGAGTPGKVIKKRVFFSSMAEYLMMKKYVKDVACIFIKDTRMEGKWVRKNV